MSPSHHPSAAILADYASGALRPAFAVVVAAHAERCARCRAELGALEALGGELIADLPAAPMAEESLERVMAGIERPLPTPEPASPPTVDRIPFGRAQWLAPGMTIRKAKLGGGDLLYLLQLPGGIKTVPHGHEGMEFTTVLDGAYDDETGRFAAGDFAELTDEADHQPTVAPGQPCVCLIASEKPMRMTTWGGRLVQWIAGV